MGRAQEDTPLGGSDKVAAGLLLILRFTAIFNHKDSSHAFVLQTLTSTSEALLSMADCREAKLPCE